MIEPPDLTLAARRPRPRARCGALFGTALSLLLLAAGTASASVLVNVPYPAVKRCGASIKVGVWRRDDLKPNPRSVLVTVRTPSGHLLWSRRLRPTGAWSYRTYRPACGHRYVVHYRVGSWPPAFRVRIRPKRRHP